MITLYVISVITYYICITFYRSLLYTYFVNQQIFNTVKLNWTKLHYMLTKVLHWLKYWLYTDWCLIISYILISGRCDHSSQHASRSQLFHRLPITNKIKIKTFSYKTKLIKICCFILYMYSTYRFKIWIYFKSTLL